jgi:hypothetical protein
VCRTGARRVGWSSTRNDAGTSSEDLVDRLPGTWSKLEMKVPRHIVGWVRSRAAVSWKAVAPHEGPGVLRGVAADAVRNRKELVFENALLRHQIVTLRRKSPRPRLTTVDRLGFSSQPQSYPRGAAPWPLCSPRPSYGGIARAFGCSGVGDPGPGAWNAGSPPKPSA